jgi:tetraacyldisaccharide 4'-kinase
MLLLPFSWLYGLGVGVRNVLFNVEILSSTSYDMPILSLGNITAGGTGKTPHTEFLIRTLSKDYQVAVLSRGYKRKTTGFVLADAQSQVHDIGDEPLQMKRKFPNVVVAVDENRRRGIAQLMDGAQVPFVDVILLDDAFQHRYVNPSISILLIDYNRLIREDFLLPAGNLREPAGQMKRAQMVVVTKCPAHLSPIELRILGAQIKVLPYQSLHFTTMVYGPLYAVAPEADTAESPEAARRIPQRLEDLRDQQLPVLIVTGIGNPHTLVDEVSRFAPQVVPLIFPDHHEFTKRDGRRIHQEFEKIRSQGGLIITTEKDATRLQHNPWVEDLLPYTCYPTLEVRFMEEGGSHTFEQKITDYVRINKRNRRFS